MKPSASLLLLLLLLPGCDPIFGVYVRQRVAPSPSGACIAAALDGAPHVVEWGPRGSDSIARYRVFFRDSLFRPVRPMAFLRVEPSADSGAVLSVEREHCCGAAVAPRDEIVRSAAALLPEIVRQCGASPRSPITCEATGFLRMRPCRVPEEADTGADSAPAS